ncbi:MFS transporter [Nocardiopsis trehalosi]|uniref:MFS transporter n=1 Tax=Nocardiopsis trehalosi TaxID=109329 RepID=UPI0012F8FF32|nr:MFS transporter [Nocardiopsis trehalosi]
MAEPRTRARARSLAGVLGAPGTAERARWAITAVFLVNGAAMASYFVRVPSLKAAHDLTDGRLGVLLTTVSVAAMISMQLAGDLTARLGSAWIARVTAIGLPVAMIGLGLAADPLVLVAVLVVFGAVDGLLDVSMNAQAVAVERALKRPIMNGCHAAWSIGAALGSTLGGLAMRADWSITRHYAVLAVLLVALAAVTGRWSLPASADRAAPADPADPAAATRPRPGWRTGWSRRVVLFGVMGASVLLLEGAIGTWSGVLLHEDRGAPLATASLGYICFTVLQVAGRLVGDRLQARFGAPTLVRVSGSLAVAGLAVVVLSPTPLPTVLGFAVVGAGVSVLLPVIFSSVGHSGGDEGAPAGAAAALSRFTTMTYTGALLGPVVIGWLAEWFGLTWTLAGLLVLLVGVVLNARATATAVRSGPPAG